MLIKCPHCGVRPVDEFAFMGDAAVKRPSTDDPDAWHAYVYLRGNPRGRIAEYAHHAGGCRAWLVVDRDTETHEVFGAVAARDAAKKPARRR